MPLDPPRNPLRDSLTTASVPGLPQKAAEAGSGPSPVAASEGSAPGIGEEKFRWSVTPRQRITPGSTPYSVIAVALIVIVGYAILTDSLLMAIVFILIGLVSHLSLVRELEARTYVITDRGFLVDHEFYEYNHVKSYWITEPDAPDGPEIIIHTDGSLVDRYFIPLADQSSSDIDTFVSEYLPKRRYEPGLVDTIGKIMHI